MTPPNASIWWPSFVAVMTKWLGGRVRIEPHGSSLTFTSSALQEAEVDTSLFLHGTKAFLLPNATFLGVI